MIIDLFLFVAAFFLTIPAVAGYFAYSYGRSFWLWFMLGCFLPVFSHLLLAFICRKNTIPSCKRKQINMSHDEETYMEEQIKQVFQPFSGEKTYPDSK